MRLVAFSTVRNEADVVEVFVRYHAPLLDRHVVVTHLSQDASADILRRLRDEGLPLELREISDAVFRQAAVATALMKELAEQEPGAWVLPLDADEFIVGGDPREVLAGLPRDRPATLPWRTYVPTPEDDETERHVLRRVRNRRDPEAPQQHKVVVASELALRRPARLSIGAHKLLHGRHGELMEPIPAGPLAFAHFPVRSDAQFRTKVLANWPGIRAQGLLRPSQARQLHVRFSDFATGEPLGPERIQELALAYPDRDPVEGVGLVDDPVQTDVELRYPDEAVPPSPLLAVAEMADALAGEVLRLDRPRLRLRLRRR
jgi:glycosyl transferase family 2